MQFSNTNIKVLLFGKNGQLGSSLHRLLGNVDLYAYDYPEINFLEPDQIRGLIKELNPEIILNAAAYTAVDDAESDQSTALQINGTTVGVIAEIANEVGAGLIHYSTDYVFNGNSVIPYKETDDTDPINYYGLTKLRGEQNIAAVDGSYLIFRLSWVYSTGFSSFVTKVLEWSRKNETLQIVEDQTSKPSWSEMIATNTIAVLDRFDRNGLYQKIRDHSGIFHLAGGGEASRFEWAKEILEKDPNHEEQIVTELVPVLSTAFPTPAQRPKYTVMDCTKFEKTFNLSLPHWKTSLGKALSGDLD